MGLLKRLFGMNKFKKKYLADVELGSEEWHLRRSTFNWDIMDLVEALKVNKKLTYLNLSGCKKIGVAGAMALVDALRENDTLTKLYLKYNSIGEQHKDILKLLPRVKSGKLKVSF